MIVPHTSVEDLHERLVEYVHSKSVTDFGAGLGTYHEKVADVARFYKLIEVHPPYCAVLRERVGRRANVEVHELNVLDVTRVPLSESEFHCDVAMAIDVIEHLEMAHARQVITAMQLLASTVVLFIPEGHHPQEVDNYKMGGDRWQTHRSTWWAGDLEALGLKVERWVDFHAGTGGGKDPGALFAVWHR